MGSGIVVILNITSGVVWLGNVDALPCDVASTGRVTEYNGALVISIA